MELMYLTIKIYLKSLAKWLNPLVIKVTLWLFNIAMENGPFIVDVPIKTSMYAGFSMAMLNNQMVSIMEVSTWENYLSMVDVTGCPIARIIQQN